MLGTAVTSPLDKGVSPSYQYMANPPQCPATTWQTPYGVGNEPTGLVRRRCRRAPPPRYNVI